MKYTCVFLAMIVACSLAVKTGTQTHMSLENQIKKLNQSPWGSVAASFLELQLTVGSPVGDLIQAFQDFLRDNDFKIEINQKDYDVQLAEHLKWEADLLDKIARNEAIIAQETSRLDNVLYPEKAQLEDSIARNNALDAQTQVEMADATAEREANHAAHVTFVEEAELAIEAIDECLVLLNSLGGDSASLIQVTKVQRAFKKVGQAIKTNSKYSPMIKALLKLTDFANPEMLARLTGKFQAVRDSLVTDIDNSNQNEADELAAYDAFMAMGAATIETCRANVARDTELLAQNAANIEASLARRAQAEVDLAIAQDDLETETNRWAGVQAMFDKMMAELANEADAINEIIDIIASVDVSDETFERMNRF